MCVCVTWMPDKGWNRELARILNIPERHFVSQSADTQSQACSVSLTAAVLTVHLCP